MYSMRRNPPGESHIRKNMYFYLWTDRGENLHDRRGVPDMGLSEFAGDIFRRLQMANKDVQMGVKMFF